MNFILFDGPNRDNLLPFTYTRPVCDIRTGILTIREKWEHFLKSETSTLTQDYLSKKFPLNRTGKDLYIDGSVIPNQGLVDEILNLQDNEILVKNSFVIAYRLKNGNSRDSQIEDIPIIETDIEFHRITNTWDIFSLNHITINDDFTMLCKGKKSEPLSDTNNIIGDPSLIFVEPGATVEFTYLNTTDGPIYIGKDSAIMEGSKIRGPFAICQHATIKMDAKIYSGTTVGPHCKIGGEVSNSVIFGYSNKGHDGFLGNSVIGEWCNLGADTNTSNLKNTYDIVKLWSIKENTFVNTGLQFCGLIMGDHSKSGINTMFNTGTVVGVSSNIYGAGFQRNFIPSFMWGGVSGLKAFNFKKSVQVATAVFNRRSKKFDSLEQEIFKYLYSQAHPDSQ